MHNIYYLAPFNSKILYKLTPPITLTNLFILFYFADYIPKIVRTFSYNTAFAGLFLTDVFVTTFIIINFLKILL